MDHLDHIERQINGFIWMTAVYIVLCAAILMKV